jgi:hypothetical protein
MIWKMSRNEKSEELTEEKPKMNVRSIAKVTTVKTDSLPF